MDEKEARTRLARAYRSLAVSVMRAESLLDARPDDAGKEQDRLRLRLIAVQEATEILAAVRHRDLVAYIGQGVS